MAWKLGHVCSQWRQVAINDPRLWSKIHVDADDWEIRSQQVETIFRRGGERLDLTLTSFDDPDHIIPTYIRPYATRLYKLLLHTDLNLMNKFIRLQPGLFVTLESIRLIVDIGKGFFELPEGGAVVFEDATSLRTFEIIDGGSSLVQGFSPNWSLPWSKLTRLVIAGFAVLSTDVILLKAKRLTLRQP